MGLKVGTKFLRTVGLLHDSVAGDAVAAPQGVCIQAAAQNAGPGCAPAEALCTIDLMCKFRSLPTGRVDAMCTLLARWLRELHKGILATTPGVTAVRFALCVDYESGVPVEKQAERHKRAAASKVEPYPTATFQSLDGAGIQFQGRPVEPLDMGRLMCTRPLRVAFYRYFRRWAALTSELCWLRAPLWFDGGPGLVWRYWPRAAQIESMPDRYSSQAGEGEVAAVAWALRGQRDCRVVWVWSGDTDAVAIAMQHTAAMTCPWVVNFADRLFCRPLDVWRRWVHETGSTAGANTRLVATLAKGSDYVDNKLGLHGVHTDCIWPTDAPTTRGAAAAAAAAAAVVALAPSPRALDRPSPSATTVVWSSPFEQEEGGTAVVPTEPANRLLPAELRSGASFRLWLRGVYTRELRRAKHAVPFVGLMPVATIQAELAAKNSKRILWPTDANVAAFLEQLIFNWTYWQTLSPTLGHGPSLEVDGLWADARPRTTTPTKRRRVDMQTAGASPGASPAKRPARSSPMDLEAEEEEDTDAAAQSRARTPSPLHGVVGVVGEPQYIAASQVPGLVAPTGPAGEATALALRTPHAEDARLRFDEASHTYWVRFEADGEHEANILSASTLIKAYFSTFVPDEAIRAMKGGRKWRPGHALWGQTDAQIKAAWAQNSLTASTRGTTLHAVLEAEMNTPGLIDSDPVYRRLLEMQAFRHWRALHFVGQGLVPLRTELRLASCGRLRLAGTLDLLAVRGDHPPPSECGGRLTVTIIDWKFSREIKGRPGDPVLPWDGCGYGPCEHLGDTNYSKYLLQQNLYCHMLETTHTQWLWRGHAYTSLHVEAMQLAVFHPNHQPHGYQHIPLPRTPNVIGRLLSDRERALAKGQTMDEFVQEHYRADYQDQAARDGRSEAQHLQAVYHRGLAQQEDNAARKDRARRKARERGWRLCKVSA